MSGGAWAQCSDCARLAVWCTLTTGNNYIEHPGQVLSKICETADIGEYTIESVVSMADPLDYKEELSQVAQSMDLENDRTED